MKSSGLDCLWWRVACNDNAQETGIEIFLSHITELFASAIDDCIHLLVEIGGIGAVAEHIPYVSGNVKWRVKGLDEVA